MFKVGDIIRLWRFPSAIDEMTGPNGPSEMPYNINRRQPWTPSEADYEKILWIGEVLDLHEGLPSAFPSFFQVRWIYPIRGTRSYSGIDPAVGFVTLYERGLMRNTFKKPMKRMIWQWAKGCGLLKKTALLMFLGFGLITFCGC